MHTHIQTQQNVSRKTNVTKKNLSKLDYLIDSIPKMYHNLSLYFYQTIWQVQSSLAKDILQAVTQ